MKAPGEVDTWRVAALHEDLSEWLLDHYQGEDVRVVSTALTGELARIVALGAHDDTDAERMVKEVAGLLGLLVGKLRHGLTGRSTH